MITVHLLTTDTHTNSFALNFPILRNRKTLLNFGIKASLFYSASDQLFDCDVLAINSKVYRTWWMSREVELLETLDSFRSKVNALLWFDTADGSGTTQFKTLPYVKGYYKNQILKDKRAYLKKYYGGRIFTDFYHHTCNIEDDEIQYTDSTPAEADLDKIDISWNFGLGDYGPRAKNYARLRKLLPSFRYYSAKFTPSTHPKPIPITCRLGRSHDRPTIRYQRDQTVATLNQHFDTPTERIPAAQYYREMQNARICISPFGWGELAYRDFEAIMSGAALFKPDMSHLATWPDIYRDGETYLSHRWDFSDFCDRLNHLLSGNMASDLAQQAQAIYRNILFEPTGQKQWCQHFADLVQKHI